RRNPCESLPPGLFVKLAGGDLARHVAAHSRDARLDAFPGNVVELYLVSGHRRHMGDATAHLTGTDDAHRPDSARHFPDPAAGDLLIASQRIWTAMCRPLVLPTLHALRCLSKRLFEFWEDLEEVADKAVVGDLEDRRFLVLVNGHDHLGVL